MIQGFEFYTEPLTTDELQLLPGFIKGFENKVGKKNAITNAQIRDAY